MICAKSLHLRKEFASANKVDAGLFSFNSKGACEACNGSGVVYTDLAFLDAFKSPCEVCQGRRFKDDVLAYKLDGNSISDVLAMTVAEAVELFQKTQRDRAEAACDARRGAHLSHTWPAAEHAFWRGMPTYQTGQRTAQGRECLRDG
jgi:hypothetical protein